jgi:hypothetical protein
MEPGPRDLFRTAEASDAGTPPTRSGAEGTGLVIKATRHRHAVPDIRILVAVGYLRSPMLADTRLGERPTAKEPA